MDRTSSTFVALITSCFYIFSNQRFWIHNSLIKCGWIVAENHIFIHIIPSNSCKCQFLDISHFELENLSKNIFLKLLTTLMPKQGKHLHLKPTSQFTYFPSLDRIFPWFSFCLTRCFLWKPEPFPGRSEDDVLWGKLGTGGSLEEGGGPTIWSPHQFNSNLPQDCYFSNIITKTGSKFGNLLSSLFSKLQTI